MYNYLVWTGRGPQDRGPNHGVGIQPWPNAERRSNFDRVETNERGCKAAAYEMSLIDGFLGALSSICRVYYHCITINIITILEELVSPRSIDAESVRYD